MSYLRLPVVGLVFAFFILLMTDMWIIPIHHAGANREGILALECIVLVLLFGAAVWDKVRRMGRAIQMEQGGANDEGHELFTWKEIGKVFACLAASMVIFVAVVKILELKSTDATGTQHGAHESAQRSADSTSN